MYTNFLKTLEDLNIYSIEAIGLEPDSVLHEPVNVQPVDDDKLK
jgi:molecular chaperone GrpE (heat shock protein)